MLASGAILILGPGGVVPSEAAGKALAATVVPGCGWRFTTASPVLLLAPRHRPLVLELHPPTCIPYVWFIPILVTRCRPRVCGFPTHTGMAGAAVLTHGPMWKVFPIGHPVFWWHWRAIVPGHLVALAYLHMTRVAYARAVRSVSVALIVVVVRQNGKWLLFCPPQPLR